MAPHKVCTEVEILFQPLTPKTDALRAQGGANLEKVLIRVRREFDRRLIGFPSPLIRFAFLMVARFLLLIARLQTSPPIRPKTCSTYC